MTANSERPCEISDRAVPQFFSLSVQVDYLCFCGRMGIESAMVHGWALSRMAEVIRFEEGCDAGDAWCAYREPLSTSPSVDLSEL